MEDNGHVPALYNPRAAPRGTIIMVPEEPDLTSLPPAHTHRISKNDLTSLWPFSWGWLRSCGHSVLQRVILFFTFIFPLTHRLVSLLLLSLNNKQRPQTCLQVLLESIALHCHPCNFPYVVRFLRGVRACNVGIEWETLPGLETQVPKKEKSDASASALPKNMKMLSKSKQKGKRLAQCSKAKTLGGKKISHIYRT